MGNASRFIICAVFGLFLLGTHFVLMAEDKTSENKDGFIVDNVIIESVSIPIRVGDIPNNVEVSCYTLVQKLGSTEFTRVHMPPLSCLIVTEENGKLVTVKPINVGSKVQLELPSGTYLFHLRVDKMTPTFSGAQRRSLEKQTTKRVWISDNMQQVEIGVIHNH